MSYKPDGYSDLSPYLLVPDPAAVLDFCAQVFGAERLRVIEEGGRIQHAECRIGDSVVMMAEAEGPPAMLHIYMDDPQAAFDRAVAAGAEVLQPMLDKGDGDLRGGFRTPCGTSWYVARQI